MWACLAGSQSIAFVTVSSRPALVFAGLALAGAALWPLREFVDAAGAASRDSSEIRPTGLSTARWTSAAIPGGMRALLADGLWLKVYATWAARDRPRTEGLIHWVTIVDDRPTQFWVNGARIIAYDITEWRLSAMNGGRVPSDVRRRVVEEQAGAALKHLVAARIRHPDSASIWVEMGNIHLYRRGDLLTRLNATGGPQNRRMRPISRRGSMPSSCAGSGAIRRLTSGSAGFTDAAEW